MEKVITYSFQDDFIKKLAEFVDEHFLRAGADTGRLAFVFGGKRPALFLKKEFSRRLRKGFVSPRFFSMDEFVEYVCVQKNPYTKARDLDNCFAIYTLAREIDPRILMHREKFYQFLPWAREILSFIEQLDLEASGEDILAQIQKSSSIGYDVPENINTLLTHIIAIRKRYHEMLKAKKVYSRGFMYLLASENIAEADLGEFDTIFFCNFFYLHKTEELIIKRVFHEGRALLFFQGDQEHWPVLAKTAARLSVSIHPKEPVEGARDLKIYSGFDVHSQATLVKEILKTIPDREDTVVVLPSPKSVIPLLSEVSSIEKNFNVSMGYPLGRTSLCALFQLIFQAQASKKEGHYYTKDYLRLLGHPLIKNMKEFPDPAVMRVLSHKIEEILIGTEKTPIGGSLFVDLAAIEGLDDVYRLTGETLDSMDISARLPDIRRALAALHDVLFRCWENVSTFGQFAGVLENVLGYLAEKSVLTSYPVNIKVSERLLSIQDELKQSSFSDVVFAQDEIFKIFENMLEQDLISFSGSPLKGLQILGLFETRSLNFKNVIVMDVNESVLPKLRIYEPLIPREVTIALGLDRLEKEEEIQRYQFMRLISAADKVHLIYQESKDKEKSRFVEDLIWQQQKRTRSLEAVPIPKASFAIKVLPKKVKIRKSPEMIAALAAHTYSASSIDTYVECPLRFYYRYVLGLQERVEFAIDPDASMIGSFIHELLEEAYKTFVGAKPVIDAKFRKYFDKLFEKKFDAEFSTRMKSDSFMLKKIMQVRLERFLDAEAAREIASLLGLESEIDDTMPLAGRTLKFKGRVDRIDELCDGNLLVIDYKTGSDDPKPASIERIQTLTLSREAIKNTVKSFQLPLYIYFVGKLYPGRPLNAGLYYLRTAEIKQLIKPKDFNADSAQRIVDTFTVPLDYIVEEIFDPEIPFTADDSDAHMCKNCPYFYLCR